MEMTPGKLAGYQKMLRAFAARVRNDATSVGRDALAQTGGQADGGLSNAPMHMADVGTETYLQELSATLLENEEYLVKETSDALRRIDQGTFGSCEHCGQPIGKLRLDAIPFARYCTACADGAAAGPDVNLNKGRASAFSEKERDARMDAADGPGNQADIHAAGTPAGGTAYGGLAGTTVGHGDPGNVPLEASAGSSQSEMRSARREGVAYASPKGGAVGGTPAGKRGGPQKPAKSRRPRHS